MGNDSPGRGGDHLLGYQWFISGNPSRPTGGDSKQFNVAFIGMGQDNLAGLEGWDLVAVWSGSVVDMGQRWNVEWEGIYRQREQEAPAFETKDGVDWYTVVRKPGWATISRVTLGILFVAEKDLVLSRLGVPPRAVFVIDLAQETAFALKNTSIGSEAVDALDWEENDIQVHVGGRCGVHLNFQLVDGNYYLEH